MPASLQLWRDRRGRVSRLRIAALLFLLAPVLLAGVAAATTNAFWARPVNDLIHRTGYWALVFLLVSLAITPLRRIGRYGQLVDVRRMIGVGAFVYAALHVLLFVVDHKLDLAKVVAEIDRRLYLTIGFAALLGLLALAVTSTDAMTRRLGGANWRVLHQTTYAITLLALVHYFQQTKADVSVPIFTAGLAGWLLGYRLLVRVRAAPGEPPTLALLLLSVAVAALTLLGEAVGIAVKFGVSPLVVLETAFDLEAGVRPGWLVLAAGLAVVALDAVRARQRPAAPPRGAAPRAVAAE